MVRVIDADTYVCCRARRTYRLRLLGVDAPEHDQPFGPQATDSVARLLAPGRVVLVARAGLDLYGRTLGAVLLPTATVAAAGRAVPLDSLLVVRGWAWAFDPNRDGGGAGAAAGGRAAGRARAVEMRREPGRAAEAVAVLQFRNQAALPGWLHLVTRPRK